jgi:hypothetical protein
VPNVGRLNHYRAFILTLVNRGLIVKPVGASTIKNTQIKAISYITRTDAIKTLPIRIPSGDVRKYFARKYPRPKLLNSPVMFVVKNMVCYWEATKRG